MELGDIRIPDKDALEDAIRILEGIADDRHAQAVDRARDGNKVDAELLECKSWDAREVAKYLRTVWMYVYAPPKVEDLMAFAEREARATLAKAGFPLSGQGDK